MLIRFTCSPRLNLITSASRLGIGHSAYSGGNPSQSVQITPKWIYVLPSIQSINRFGIPGLFLASFIAKIQNSARILKPRKKSFSELITYPQPLAGLLLKTKTMDVSNTGDLTLKEIGYLPINTATCKINLLQLHEPSLRLATADFITASDTCRKAGCSGRKLKAIMGVLGINVPKACFYLGFFRQLATIKPINRQLLGGLQHSNKAGMGRSWSPRGDVARIWRKSGGYWLGHLLDCLVFRTGSASGSARLFYRNYFNNKKSIGNVIFT